MCLFVPCCGKFVRFYFCLFLNFGQHKFGLQEYMIKYIYVMHNISFCLPLSGHTAQFFFFFFCFAPSNVHIHIH